MGRILNPSPEPLAPCSTVANLTACCEDEDKSKPLSQSHTCKKCIQGPQEGIRQLQLLISQSAGQARLAKIALYLVCTAPMLHQRLHPFAQPVCLLIVPVLLVLCHCCLVPLLYCTDVPSSAACTPQHRY